jgi:hypothetical protein
MSCGTLDAFTEAGCDMPRAVQALGFTRGEMRDRLVEADRRGLVRMEPAKRLTIDQ